MNLQEIVRRTQPPVPWAEGEKIPWNEPGFSARMLNEHLSQTHDLASRRSEIIDRHVAWIHDSVLGGCPSRVLDLGCGPGLYTQRLARLGHCCTGVDFGPASIAYARGQAAAEGLACRYIEADMRTIGALALDPVDLVMLVYGEFNAHPRRHTRGRQRPCHVVQRRDWSVQRAAAPDADGEPLGRNPVGGHGAVLPDRCGIK
jgi:SAM-dependent methyltransferase